jgi:hypothetical protein
VFLDNTSIYSVLSTLTGAFFEIPRTANESIVIIPSKHLLFLPRGLTGIFSLV